MGEREARVIYEREQQTGNSRMELRLTEDWRMDLKISGEGSVEGTHRLLEALEEALDAYPEAPPLDSAVDLSELRKSPLRAQFIMGKWLMGRRGRVGRLAVYEGQPLEMKLARAITRLARLDKVGFYEHRDDAMRWLERD